MQGNIYYFGDQFQARVAKTGNGGEPPMTVLEQRVEKLERSYLAIEKDLAVIKSNYATKADLANLKAGLSADFASAITGQTWKIVIFMVATAGLSLAVARYLFQ